MSSKIFSFLFSLIFITCFLEVKSDISHIAGGRKVIDQYGRLIPDGPVRNSIMIIEQHVNPAPPTEIITMETLMLERLADMVDENAELVRRVEAQFPQAQSNEEQNTRNLHRQNLNNLFISLREQSEIGLVSQEQRANNRRILKRTLQTLNDHLERTLARFVPLQRSAELSAMDKYFQILDNYRKREDAERAKEKPARDEIIQNLRNQQYHSVDKLESFIRNRMNLIRERHIRQLPINAEHISLVSDLKTLFTSLRQRVEKIDKRRALDKQNAQALSHQENHVQQQRLVQKPIQEHVQETGRSREREAGESSGYSGGTSSSSSGGTSSNYGGRTSPSHSGGDAGHMGGMSVQRNGVASRNGGSNFPRRF